LRSKEKEKEKIAPRLPSSHATKRTENKQEKEKRKELPPDLLLHSQCHENTRIITFFASFFPSHKV
jgi:hypothetical protein